MTGKRKEDRSAGEQSSSESSDCIERYLLIVSGNDEVGGETSEEASTASLLNGPSDFVTKFARHHRIQVNGESEAAIFLPHVHQGHRR